MCGTVGTVEYGTQIVHSEARPCANGQIHSNIGNEIMIRFVMVGGFLGAGKTTAIARLARQWTDAGYRVGIVTNDQAYDLVDTRSLRAQGFDVGEVPGACFCCKFNDLLETVEQLERDKRPDVVITEPVGSCTDLVATVIEPLRSLHGDMYEIAPLAVLLKPEHGLKILANESAGFSPKAAYIFLKQIEEADIVAINKIDKLQPEQQEHLRTMLLERFPDKQVLLTSGKLGEGFDQLASALQQPRKSGQDIMEVDYDIYAEGEAELGWLNCTASVAATGSANLSLDRLASDTTQQIANELNDCKAEAAHLKVLAESPVGSAIANLVGSAVDVELSVPSHADCPEATLVINARVVCDPEKLEQIVLRVLERIALQHTAKIEAHDMQRFRPGRPVPTHRFA